MRLVNIGFGSTVNAARIVVILKPDSAPIRRRIQEAKEGRQLIDATYGRKIRAVLMMDSGHVVVSAIAPETIAARLSTERGEEEWTAEKEC
ncbi:MAG: DUF370 domain-containing protein [Lachnospiraceae bacterium]|jgi:regulator of extracellular matrix RemA (YlzA/DUF370 family)|nr:DUF370 domain-containing protein [Lachnospiraceae bacterium]